MPEENTVVIPTNPAPQTGMTGIVQLAPLAIPLTLPLVLHALTGIAISSIGVAAAGLVLGPKGRELVTSSGEAIIKMLPGAEKKEPVTLNKEELNPVQSA